MNRLLAEHLPWHGARINFLAQFLLALLKVRSVNLAELSSGFSGKAKVESHYKRLQRFFRGFEIDQDALARLRVRLVPVGDGSWRLAMDRTCWQFGKADLNFLMLGIAWRGVAMPLFWTVLAGPGNSDTAERIALMERFLQVFGNRMMRLDQQFGSLKPGESHRLPGRRPVWGCFVHLSALRLDEGDFLFIASFGAPQAEAIDAYADRWQVETLFCCLKTRGFNLEDTHLTDPKRLAKLMSLLALAFAWTCRTGELLHDGPSPIRQKKP